MLFEKKELDDTAWQSFQYWGLAKVEKPSLILSLNQSLKLNLSQSKVETSSDDELQLDTSDVTTVKSKWENIWTMELFV